MRWQKEVGGDAAYLHKGIIATADSGCVILTNRYENIYNIGYESDLYYLKLDKNGELVEPLQVSIKEFDQNKILFYPNPASDILNINRHYFLKNKNLKFKIYDLAVQLVLSKYINKNDILIKHLSKGIYSLTLSKSQKKLYYQKLIIN